MEIITAEEMQEKYLRNYSIRTVKERIVHRPDFPTPIRVGRKRVWLIDEFTKWFFKQKS